MLLWKQESYSSDHNSLLLPYYEKVYVWTSDRLVVTIDYQDCTPLNCKLIPCYTKYNGLPKIRNVF